MFRLMFYQHNAFCIWFGLKLKFLEMLGTRAKWVSIAFKMSICCCKIYMNCYIATCISSWSWNPWVTLCLLSECVLLDRDRVNPVVMPNLCPVDVRAYCKMCLYKCYFSDGYDTENMVVPE